MKFTNPLRFPYWKGRLYLGNGSSGLPVGVKLERHALTIAASRAGKGACFIIPNLRRWPHNALVIDPKGEAARETWGARMGMGQAVHVLDPFGVADVPDHLRARFNPLDAIDTNELTAREEIRVLADGLVMRHNRENAYFDNAAVDILAGVIAHTCDLAPPDERNMQSVAEIAAEVEEYRDELASNGAAGGLMPAAASRLPDPEGNKPPGDFMGTVQESAGWLGSPSIQSVMTDSTFRLSDLKTKPCTVYLVLPPDMLNEHGRFLRLFVAAALREMSRYEGGRRCLFVLDEFYALGRLESLVKAIGSLPSYGVHLWPILQDLGQLHEAYGRETTESLFGNADAQMFFGTSDMLTLQHVSDMLGMEREAVPQFSGKTGGLVPRMSPQKIRAHVAKRPRDKVAQNAIVFAHGDSVLSVKPRPYFL